MQRLEVSGAVRPIYGSLGVKRLKHKKLTFYNNRVLILVYKKYFKASKQINDKNNNTNFTQQPLKQDQNPRNKSNYLMCNKFKCLQSIAAAVGTKFYRN